MYHVIITDKENKELVNEDVNAIICGTSTGEANREIAFTDCNGKELLATVFTTLSVVKKVLDKAPALKIVALALIDNLVKEKD